MINNKADISVAQLSALNPVKVRNICCRILVCAYWKRYIFNRMFLFHLSAVPLFIFQQLFFFFFTDLFFFFYSGYLFLLLQTSTDSSWLHQLMLMFFLPFFEWGGRLKEEFFFESERILSNFAFSFLFFFLPSPPPLLPFLNCINGWNGRRMLCG